MTPNEFVKLYMQNCQYRKELSLMTAAIAEENGLVVVFGASDDLCEIRGAEDDEIDCFDGGEATIAGAKVKINWCKDGYSWTYDTDIPHECFDVYDKDNELYCRGIVFAKSDVRRLSSADVAPVIHSSWEIVKTGDSCFDYYFRCNHCHKNTPDKGFMISPDYCPWCGAKMDGKDDEQ